MTDKQIIEEIKTKEKEGADMGAFFDVLVSEGKTTYSDLVELIGVGSDAYPKGFPGYYQTNPTYSSIRSAQLRAERHGVKMAIVL